jgi:hypothetical protein
MYPHVIRLRGPWEVEATARAVEDAAARVGELDAPLPPKFRMTMPERWDHGPLAAFAGRVRFRRRFGYPGRIDVHERVWLTFAGVVGSAEVSLNGRRLGSQQGATSWCEFEVMDILKDRNELVMEMEVVPPCACLWEEVALEVRCTAFLRGVEAWATPADRTVCLHVSGEVIGKAERPLELYVLLDGATVHYTTTEPVSAGLPFHVVVADLAKELWRPRADTPGGGHVVRVDLVNGATVWYTVECLVRAANPSMGDRS